MGRRIEDVWQRLNFAQAFVVVAALAGVVCMVLFAPPTFWAHLDQVDWKFWVGVLLAATGVTSPFLNRLLGERRDSTPPPGNSGNGAP
jgi:drug/metabolite transporter (DMT)-like permease